MYEQNRKNTVKAENQLKIGEHIVLTDPENPGPRILFVGNSITLHGILPEIGWHGHWGMAASAPEKDYVHLLMNKIREQRADAAFCVCQVADWERQYQNGSVTFPQYQAAAEFRADILVLRLVENCPAEGFDGEVFSRSLQELFRFLSGNQSVKAVVATSFWHHPGDPYLEAFATENGFPTVTLGDLGEDDRMKAIGLFEHTGVANHPGDLGMQTIADRIFEALKVYI